MEIWVVDRITAKTVFREVILGLYDPREAPEVIAIRVVETLRATLMEVEHPRATSIDTLPAPEIDVLANTPSESFRARSGRRCCVQSRRPRSDRSSRSLGDVGRDVALSPRARWVAHTWTRQAARSRRRDQRWPVSGGRFFGILADRSGYARAIAL